MEIFSRHELIQAAEGYTLVLYVDKQTSEFAEELFGGKGKELSGNALEQIRNYINENYQDIKISTVKIMAGSLLVASIAYSTFSSLAPAAPLPKQALPEAQAQDSSPAAQAPAKLSLDILLVNKTHSLPDGYVPSELVSPKVSAVNSTKTKMTPEAAAALEALFTKAKHDNIKLTAISGYRSYERQKAIFTSNTSKYGSAAAANQFSARPGQSEHQTGLAMDVSSPSVNFALTQAFAETREGQWLKENAPHFGFIIRYPKNKEAITGYQYEPWHIRYVGKSTSLEIAARNITLEEYLAAPASD